MKKIFLSGKRETGDKRDNVFEDSIVRISKSLLAVTEESIEAGAYAHPPQTLSKYPTSPPYLGRRIIATIGTERLDGIPAIVVVDEIDLLYAKEKALGGKICNLADNYKLHEEYQLFVKGYKAAQSKGAYSDEQLRSALSKAFIASQEGYQITSDEIVESLNQPKQISELVLDYEFVCKNGHTMNYQATCSYPHCHKPNKEAIIIHDREQNAIIPVSIKF